MNNQPKIITIDGPSGAGKGTVAGILARKLGFKLLDSGALYRLVAYAATNHGVGLDNQEALMAIAVHLDVQFIAGVGEPQKVILEGKDVTSLIRTEVVAAGASKVSALPLVREALLQRQREFAEAPGLIADGRDMGTVVFPGATCKVYLTASAAERARRRHDQLTAKGEVVSLLRILAEIQERDERDSNRAAAPLKAAEGALIIDSSDMTIDQVVIEIESALSAATSR